MDNTKSNEPLANLYNSQYKFTINTNEIIYTERGNYHSYSFAVYPDEGSDLTQNLFIHLQPDGTYSCFLIQYNLSKADLDNMKRGAAVTDLNIKTTFTRLDDFHSDSVIKCFFSNLVVSCQYSVTVTTVPASQGDLVGCNDPDCLYDYVYTYTLIGCSYTSTGGCGGGSVLALFNPGHGGYSTNPNYGNQPVIPINVSDDTIDIRNLNKITNTDSPLRPTIDQYADNLSDPLVEEGVEFRTVTVNTYTSQPVQQQNQYSVKFFPAVINSLIRIHKHHEETDPVFSMGDFFGMADFINRKPI